MLAPHELKNKAFSRSVRGYNASEVDDHIEFLIEKYTELYRENTELNRKLRVVGTKLDEISDERDAIRSTLVSAQKMSEKIIMDANDKANLITNSIKERCDAVIDDFKRRMAKEKEDMWRIRTAVLDFKQQVFDIYRRHIEELQGINVNKLEDIVLPDEQAIVENILGDVAEAVKNDNAAALKDRESENLNPAPPRSHAAEPTAVPAPPAATVGKAFAFAEAPDEEAAPVEAVAPAEAVSAEKAPAEEAPAEGVPAGGVPAERASAAAESAQAEPAGKPAKSPASGKHGTGKGVGDDEDDFIKSLENAKIE